MTDEHIRELAEAAAVEIVANIVMRRKLRTAWDSLDDGEQEELLDHWTHIITDKLREVVCL